MSLAFVIKAPGCLGDDAPYTCYSDLGTSLEVEGYATGRIPFLEPCPPTRSPFPCDEYPPLTMYVMRAVAVVGATPRAFFAANAALLAMAGLGLILIAHRIDPARSILVAAAPTLALSGFLNWDLLGVMVTSAGVLFALKRRWITSGILFGVGGLLKLFPLLFVIPLFLSTWRTSRSGARKLATVAASTFVLAHVPLIVIAPSRWLSPYSFASRRIADVDTLWHVVCTRTNETLFCGWKPVLLNVLSAAILVGGTALCCRRWLRTGHPWSLFIPMLAFLLLGTKVYSPQFSLWLLPWLALWSRTIIPWATFGLADLLVGSLRARWLQEFTAAVERGASHYSSSLNDAFHLAIGLRTVVLVGLIVWWVRRTRPSERFANQWPNTL